MPQPDQTISISREDLASIVRARDMTSDAALRIQGRLDDIDRQIAALNAARAVLASEHHQAIRMLTIINDAVLQYECRL